MLAEVPVEVLRGVEETAPVDECVVAVGEVPAVVVIVVAGAAVNVLDAVVSRGVDECTVAVVPAVAVAELGAVMLSVVTGVGEGAVAELCVETVSAVAAVVVTVEPRLVVMALIGDVEAPVVGDCVMAVEAV